MTGSDFLGAGPKRDLISSGVEMAKAVAGKTGTEFLSANRVSRIC